MIIANKSCSLVYQYHEKYSLPDNSSFESLHVSWLKLGTSSAERAWKELKRVKSGRELTYQMKTASNSPWFQACMVGGRQLRRWISYGVRQTWNIKIWHLSELSEWWTTEHHKNTMDFHAWQESWKKVMIPRMGNKILNTWLLRKYGGI